MFDARIVPGGMQSDLGDAIAGAFAAHAALPDADKKEFFVYRTPDGQYFYSDLHPYYYDQIRGGPRREEINDEMALLNAEMNKLPDPEALRRELAEISDPAERKRVKEKVQADFREKARRLEELKRERNELLSQRARVLIAVTDDQRAVVYGITKASRIANAKIVNDAGAENREDRKRQVVAEIREGVPEDLRVFDVALENWRPREFMEEDSDAGENLRAVISNAKKLLGDPEKNPKKEQVNVYRNEDGSYDLVPGRFDPKRQRVARLWDPKNGRGPQVQWDNKQLQELHDGEFDPRTIVPGRGDVHTSLGRRGEPGLSGNPAEDRAMHLRAMENIRQKMVDVRNGEFGHPTLSQEFLLGELEKDFRHHAAMAEQIENMMGDRDAFETDRERFEREHAISKGIRDAMQQAAEAQKQTGKTVQVYLNDDGEFEVSTERYDSTRNRIARITPGGKSGVPTTHWENEEYKDIYDEAEFSLPTLIKQYFDVEQSTNGFDFHGKFLVRDFAGAANNGSPRNARNLEAPL
jgi:hypothetical protein